MLIISILIVATGFGLIISQQYLENKTTSHSKE
jgi:hypothetical protein